MSRTSLLLADDHGLLLDGLVPILRRDFEVLGVAKDGRKMVEIAKSKQPDVIVTDISMPDLNGLDAVRMLRKDLRSTKFLFLTMYADLPLAEEAFRAGASGFVLKTCDTAEVVKAIRSVAAGQTYVTPSISGDLISTLMTAREQDGLYPSLSLRQREVLKLLAEGKTMKEAAALLGISKRTAECHKYEMMRRLGVTTTVALIRYAVRMEMPENDQTCARTRTPDST
jgi:DNA-binding NarL/FixJ family response regulator